MVTKLNVACIWLESAAIKIFTQCITLNRKILQMNELLAFGPELFEEQSLCMLD